MQTNHSNASKGADDKSLDLQQQIINANEHNQALKIIGGNSKLFYGHNINGEILNTSPHRGIINYEPTELFITARSGTPLKDINQILADNNQILGFEPPSFSPNATIGGTIACNLSGPRRAYAGAARDFLLGCNIINGKGDMLSFGGQVMKNVAGYDASRLMAGALGTLGVILNCSIKTLPKPEAEATLVIACSEEKSINIMRDFAQKSLPISATCFIDAQLYIRLSGTEASVIASGKKMGGDILADAEIFWEKIKEQQHDFFQSDKPLWRLSLAADAPLLRKKNSLIEWSGALRWIHADTSDSNAAKEMREYAKAHGGHAILFNTNNITADEKSSASENNFHLLPDELKHIHKELKKSFDPKGILNHGKLHPEF